MSDNGAYGAWLRALQLAIPHATSDDVEYVGVANYVQIPFGVFRDFAKQQPAATGAPRGLVIVGSGGTWACVYRRNGGDGRWAFNTSLSPPERRTLLRSLGAEATNYREVARFVAWPPAMMDARVCIEVIDVEARRQRLYRQVWSSIRAPVSAPNKKRNSPEPLCR